MDCYRQTTTKDGRPLILRSASGADAEEYLLYYNTAHGETDFLTTYPDESRHSVQSMAERLEKARFSDRELELCAFVNGKLVGSAGFAPVRERDKTRHRAELGISILKEYRGLGIGFALMKACLALAGEAGYLQAELEVVAENERAVCLYKKLGFIEYGRNPRAFLTREGKWQEVLLMRRELLEK